jgi:RsiW-degrading membrane proteinase PrsW (M82 family)
MLMLNAYQVYLIFPILGAVAGAMLWLSYFKRIDILEHERVIDLSLAFIIGYLTPSLALWVYNLLERFGINFNGHVINDFLYAILGVGLTEELVKLVGVFVAFKLLKKRIDEPLDYLIFAGVVALGFSVRENFIYYNNYGSQIITGRTLISCLTHIINTSICVYGIYRFSIFHKGNTYINSLVAVSIAVGSHGLFDFFLTQPIIGSITPFLATLVYLIGINFWIQMMNNCINFSPFFNYKKISTLTQLHISILFWYAVLLTIEFSYGFYYKGLLFAAKDLVQNILKEGVLITIVLLRISRLKISKRKYFPVKIQIPIYYSKNDDEDFRLFGIPIKIRGENRREFRFLEYMGKDVYIHPVSKENTLITETHRARLLKKYFLKNDVVIYLIEIANETDTHKDIYLLKPLTRHIKNIDESYPVGMLMEYKDPADFQREHEAMPYKKLKSIEKIYVVHMS